jgi:NAD(P)-dependent dehydrogenase (short-subunit alcohol dehydrogenase family)
VADLVHRDPDRMRTLELDITDLSRIDAAVAEALTWQGRIDVLVNNAGRGMVGAVEATTDRELRDLMDLHFFGPAALTRAVLPHLRARGSGAIVQLTSMGGRLSFPGVGGYSATKFALEGWSEALAAEVAPFGVRVLIVEPGAFRTSFNGPQALAVTAVHEAYEDQIARVRANLSEGDGRQPPRLRRRSCRRCPRRPRRCGCRWAGMRSTWCGPLWSAHSPTWPRGPTSAAAPISRMRRSAPEDRSSG